MKKSNVTEGILWGKNHLFLRKYGSFLKIFSQKDVFPELIFSFWENILLGNCLLGNNTSGKVSLWETVLLGNWPSGKNPSGKLTFWETVLLGNFLLGKILWETVFWEFTSGKLPNTEKSTQFAIFLASKHEKWIFGDKGLKSNFSFVPH